MILEHKAILVMFIYIKLLYINNPLILCAPTVTLNIVFYISNKG